MILQPVLLRSSICCTNRSSTGFPFLHYINKLIIYNIASTRFRVKDVEKTNGNQLPTCLDINKSTLINQVSHLMAKPYHR